MAGNISANENVDLSGSLFVVIDKNVSFHAYRDDSFQTCHLLALIGNLISVNIVKDIGIF